ncbi:PREDICTED: very-long-chain (3R)-3-hydroxyacyl-CoA dehydratase-like isoform X2 [Priapulus caudatus]|nr:PREDICTED: very-long-chain (3R)-3-hydroxyacyl-CoA dehydratase-like isoform X2 [Priapulus caudatus]
MDFYLPVKPKECSYRVQARQVEFSIKKQGPEFWPRLIVAQKKPHWLKIDFDKWQDEDEDEPRQHKEDFGDVGPFDEARGRKMVERQEKQESMNFKLRYIFVYNLFQFVGFTTIFCTLFIRYLYYGERAVTTAFETIGSQLVLTQLLTYLEVIHPLLKITKGGALAPFLQVCGRNLVLILIIATEPRLQGQPVVFWLFLVWSLSEIFRYPYYMLSSLELEWYAVTWCRYTTWTVLYPAGFACEAMVILAAIPMFEETQKWTLALPNVWNLSFTFPAFLRMYLLLLFMPACWFLVQHMYKQRKAKLGPFQRKKRMKKTQ